MLAVLVQVLVIVALFPATRSFALTFVGMLVNLCLGLALLAAISRNRSLVSGGIRYFFLVLVLMMIQRFVLLKLGLDKESCSMIGLGLLYPTIIPFMAGLMQREQQAKTSKTQQKEPEKLRNHHGF